MHPKNSLITIPSTIKLSQFKTLKKFKLAPASPILQQEQTYTCQMEGNKNTNQAIRMSRPVPYDCLVFYVEICCREIGSQGKCFSFGIDLENTDKVKPLGKSSTGVGLVGNQIIYCGVKAEILEKKVKNSDHVGVGFIPENGQAFFTHNGIIISQKYRLVVEKPLYVAISLKEKGQSFRVLEEDLWKFSISNFSKILNKSAIKSISHCHQNLNERKYNMVYQYLQATNCLKTATLFKQELPKTVNNIQLCNHNHMKNPTLPSDINQNLLPFAERDSEVKKSYDIEKGSDQEMLSPSSSMKVSQISESSFQEEQNSEFYEGEISESDENEQQYMMTVFLRGGHEKEVEQWEKKRKIKEKKQKYRKKMQEMKKKQKNSKKNTGEQNSKQSQLAFILYQLPAILSMIKNSSPDLAHKQLKLKLPEIFQISPYLEGFFSGCVFLQIIKNQGPLQAIQFAKKDESLHQYESCLFRFVCQDGKIQEKPLRDILRRLDGQFNYQKQMQIFSEYLQELILRKMGYYSHNILQLYLQHTNCIKNLLKKRNVPCCGVSIPDFS